MASREKRRGARIISAQGWRRYFKQNPAQKKAIQSSGLIKRAFRIDFNEDTRLRMGRMSGLAELSKSEKARRRK